MCVCVMHHLVSEWKCIQINMEIDKTDADDWLQVIFVKRQQEILEVP